MAKSKASSNGATGSQRSASASSVQGSKVRKPSAKARGKSRVEESPERWNTSLPADFTAKLKASCHSDQTLRDAGWNVGKSTTPEFSTEADGTRFAVALACNTITVGGTRRRCLQICAVDVLTREKLLDFVVRAPEQIEGDDETKIEFPWYWSPEEALEVLTAEGLNEGIVESTEEARAELYQYIDSDTIIVGHNLYDDLCGLGMVHSQIVDSSILTQDAVIAQTESGECPVTWELKEIYKELCAKDIDVASVVDRAYAARDVVIECFANAKALQKWALIKAKTDPRVSLPPNPIPGLPPLTTVERSPPAKATPQVSRDSTPDPESPSLLEEQRSRAASRESAPEPESAIPKSPTPSLPLPASADSDAAAPDVNQPQAIPNKANSRAKVATPKDVTSKVIKSKVTKAKDKSHSPETEQKKVQRLKLNVKPQKLKLTAPKPTATKSDEITMEQIIDATALQRLKRHIVKAANKPKKSTDKAGKRVFTEVDQNQCLSTAYEQNLPDNVTQTLNEINDKVHLVQADITTLKVDCIVNAANSKLLNGSGVNGDIWKEVGRKVDKVFAALPKRHCATGDAVTTDGFHLCQKIIHTVAPRYRPLSVANQREQLRKCYRKALAEATAHGMKSIAFPALGSATYHWTPNIAAAIAIDEVSKFLYSKEGMPIEKVVFCTSDNEATKCYVNNLLDYFYVQ